MKDNHDRRRHFRPAYRPDVDTSSFDRAARLVDRLLQHVRVDVRFNADPGNVGDFPRFIDFAAAQGWFEAPYRCVVMPAKLAAYSDRSWFMRRRELTEDQFESLQAIARERLPLAAQDPSEIGAGIPYPRTSVCGALAPDSAVVGADGLEYRCGLQVGETHRAVGRLFGDAGVQESFQDGPWWEAFDPTVLPTCSRCSFLPVCWGGCPKRHLDQSHPDVEAQGRFWRTNLPRMIAAGVGADPDPGFVFGAEDQFRGEA